MPKAVCYAGLFFEVANRYCLAFKLVFATYREEIELALLGMGLTTLREVPIPVSRLSIVAVARNSD